MSNPLERKQQPPKENELLSNSSIETNSTAGVAVQALETPSDEAARERFFKQFEAIEEQKKPADYGTLLENAQLENEATIDLTESLQQVKTRAERVQHFQEKETGTRQSREESKKGLQEEEKVNEKKKSQDTEKATSREAVRKNEQEATKKLRVRLFPIWLRLVVVLVLCVVALTGGAMIGYGIIGKGNPLDVFDVKTWTHIRDIIYLKK